MSSITDQQLAEWLVVVAARWPTARVGVAGGHSAADLLPVLAGVPALVDALIAERARSRELHAALREIAIERWRAPQRGWTCGECQICQTPQSSGEPECHQPNCLAAPDEEVLP